MNFKHGFARKGQVERLHCLWRDMIKRCAHHPDYVGRGISVCDEWQDYLPFRNWAIKGYRPSLTLDRIDNDKGYAPDNCRWATKKQQARNRRSSRMITFNGKTQPIAAWADDTGIKAGTIQYRLYRGWPIPEVLRY